MTAMIKDIKSPLATATVEGLRAGMRVLLSGIIYTARDAAHRRLVQALDEGQDPPFAIAGQTIYYMGPSPARPGRIIGAAGPTTSGRMDTYTPRLLAAGVKAMIGKGSRSIEVKNAIRKHRAVYFVTLAGAGALLARTMKEVEVVAYPELGAEAVRRLVVADFPAIVAGDVWGGDIYERGRAQYRKE